MDHDFIEISKFIKGANYKCKNCDIIIVKWNDELFEDVLKFFDSETCAYRVMKAILK